MEPSMSWQAAVDFWHPNQYGLKKYLIRDGKKHPFALICPGGGYQMVCSFVEGAPCAKALNALGYAAFVLYYRCRRRGRYPAPQEDATRALRYILGHADDLGIDPDGYSLWGSSAGGHLAASMAAPQGFSALELPQPAALILSYPVVTMGKLTHPGSRKNLLGSAPSPELVERLSIETQVTSDFPPTFLWWGDADEVVSPENSQMLIHALAQNSITYEQHKYPGIGHGVGLGRGLPCEDWLNSAVRFWETQRGKLT